MDAMIYEVIWDELDPLMEKYLTDLAALHTRDPKPVQADYNKLHADFAEIRDAIPLKYGYTFEQAEDANDARLEAKYALRLRSSVG